MLTEELQQHTARTIMNTYARLPIGLVRGQGCTVYDAEDRDYLDFVAGIAVNALGHGHPGLVTAIARQAQRLLHTSNLFYSEPQVRLASRLVSHSFADKVFFCNSGAEANEAAIKLARRHAFQHHGPDRHEIITMHHSFHGRTLATLTATGQPRVQHGFAPLMPGFTYAGFNDVASIERQMTPHTAAVMIEPIQGEGGVVVADRAFWESLQQLCRDRGVLLIVDEIQTGMGRTGTLFAYEQIQIRPDIMTLAKGLGGGLPIGVCLATDDVARAFDPGSHASTFGGNPLACAGALAVFQALVDDHLLEHSRAMGAYLHQGLQELKSRCALIADVRGLGLLQGMELTMAGHPIVQDCLARRVLINCTRENVLRFVPPLIVTTREIDRLLNVLSDTLTKRLSRVGSRHAHRTHDTRSSIRAEPAPGFDQGPTLSMGDTGGIQL